MLENELNKIVKETVNKILEESYETQTIRYALEVESAVKTALIKVLSKRE